MKKTKIGIIGCGMISDTYFSASKTFPMIEVAGCMDIIEERAREKGAKYGVPAMSAEELLNNPEIEIVLNLTPPLEHSKVDMAALKAGKHVYSEKPFGVDFDDAQKIITLAKEKNLRVGCAPDTFLGGGLQTCRKLIDDGWIGRPVAGTAIVAGRGPEKWPQAPFFYDYGAGPMLDLGPYYITALVNMLGPAKSVIAKCSKSTEFRTLGEEVSPTYQDRYKPFDKYPIKVNTHLTGVVEFQCGALITVITSFDVYRHDHNPIEIYGTEGSIVCPDPNTFGGNIKVFRKGFATSDWKDMPYSHIYTENSRSIGIADMSIALQNNRPHRCSGELAMHVLEIMLAFDKSSALNAPVQLTTTCRQPAPLPLGLDKGELPE